MARYIRRHSMERLELYDLDAFTSPNPPLPPPRKTDFRRASMNPSVERYQFLCNVARNRTDPIYAATPMFTTIPNSKAQTTHRQLLGAYVREENVKQLDSSTTRQSPEKQTDKGQENEDEDEVEDQKDEQASDGEQFSSSSSGSEKEEEEDDDEDAEEEKGIVEQIINRDKKN